MFAYGDLRMECCKIKYKDLSLVEIEYSEMEKNLQLLKSKRLVKHKSGTVYYKPPVQEHELSYLLNQPDKN